MNDAKVSARPRRPITSTAAVVSLAVLCCALWGSAIPGVRLGYHLLGITSSDMGSQLMFAGTRFFLAGFIVALFYAITHRDFGITKPQFVLALKLSAFQTMGQYLFYYLGLAHTTGVNGSIIQGVGVFVAVIMSCVIFSLEPLTRAKIAGCALGFVGLLIASGVGSAEMGFSFAGEGLLLIACVSGSYAAIQMRKYSQEVNPIKLTGWQFMMGGAVLAICGKAFGGNLHITNPSQLGILLWLVMVSCVAYGTWSCLLRDNDVSRVLIYKFTNPIFGVVFSLMILGTEGSDFGIHTLLGLALICIGIIVVQKKPRKA